MAPPDCVLRPTGRPIVELCPGIGYRQVAFTSPLGKPLAAEHVGQVARTQAIMHPFPWRALVVAMLSAAFGGRLKVQPLT